MREFRIGNSVITDESPAYVICEIGHNHMGDADVCMDMILTAKQNGADCVKLQRINAKKLFTEAAYNEPYNSENAFAPTYGKHREALTLSDEDFHDIVTYCKSIGIDLACTAFEEDSAEFLNSIGVDIFKLASFHLRDYDLIDKLMDFDKPIIMSTGGAVFKDVMRSVEYIFKRYPADKLDLLQCTSAYPNLDAISINLGVIREYAKTFPNMVIGYSHHHPSITAISDSYHYGARIVEFHMTLNRAWKGTDQSFSIEPHGVRSIVDGLYEAREISGTEKGVYSTEMKPLKRMSRSIYAVYDIEVGEIISPHVIESKAPALGASVMHRAEIVGSRAKVRIKRGDPINLDDIGDYNGKV